MQSVTGVTDVKLAVSDQDILAPAPMQGHWNAVLDAFIRWYYMTDVMINHWTTGKNRYLCQIIRIEVSYPRQPFVRR